MPIFSLFLILMSLTVSCSRDKCANDTESEECKISEVEKIGFFDITYETIATRAVGGSSAWSDVAGCREMKFATDQKFRDEDSLPSELSGDFTVALQNFKRTPSSGLCTGGNTGKFSLTFQDQESADVVPADEKPPFSIFDPYNEVNRINNNDEEVNNDPENEIRTYIFGMLPSRENMSPASQCLGQIYCPSSPGGVNDPAGIDQDKNPCSYSFKIVRFPNGHLILDDTSKGIQYYLKPRLSSDSASKCIQTNIPK